MKTKFLLFLLLFSKALLAQGDQDKVIFLDSLSKETKSENYSYKLVIKDYYKDKAEYQWLEYYKSGKLKSEKTLSGKNSGHYIGEVINYDENGNKIDSAFYKNGKITGRYTKWLENGSIREEGIYNPEKINTKEHYLVENIWDENGNKIVENGNGLYESYSDDITEKGEFKNGLKNGTWTTTYSQKPLISYTEKYLDGDFISGYNTDENGVRHNYNAMETKPYPKKGLPDFYKFIGNRFIYTKESIKNNIQGKIFITFVVDADGKIIEPKIIRGLGYGLDEEAIRVITIYEKWIPGEQRGVKIRCQYMLPLLLKAQ